MSGHRSPVLPRLIHDIPNLRKRHRRRIHICLPVFSLQDTLFVKPLHGQKDIFPFLCLDELLIAVIELIKRLCVPADNLFDFFSVCRPAHRLCQQLFGIFVAFFGAPVCRLRNEFVSIPMAERVLQIIPKPSFIPQLGDT